MAFKMVDWVSKPFVLLYSWHLKILREWLSQNLLREKEFDLLDYVVHPLFLAYQPVHNLLQILYRGNSWSRVDGTGR